jgi:hypothetical protein
MATATHPSMHNNSFFAAAATVLTDPSSSLLSTQYGISPLSYHD